MPNLVEKGNNLTAPLIQAGWSVNGDGYGLMTSTTRFKADHTASLTTFTARGNPHPDPAYTFLKIHKYSISWDALGIAVVTIDYVGIDPTFNSGNFTNPEVSAANGLTSENITTNPNFFTDGGDGYGAPIAGAPPFTQSPIGPLVEIKNPADYIQVVTGSTVAVVNKKQSYLGSNGACFEDVNGGRFIGFVNPANKHFYGKTNYLCPQTTFSGHFYTTQAAKVNQALNLLNSTSDNNNWFDKLPNIIPSYAGITWTSSPENGEYDQLLLSQVNVQDFGSLYKVNYEVRYSVQGWPQEVYPRGSVL
jgi:hypothetical protein